MAPMAVGDEACYKSKEQNEQSLCAYRDFGGIGGYSSSVYGPLLGAWRLSMHEQNDTIQA